MHVHECRKSRSTFSQEMLTLTMDEEDEHDIFGCICCASAVFPSRKAVSGGGCIRYSQLVLSEFGGEVGSPRIRLMQQMQVPGMTAASLLAVLLLSLPNVQTSSILAFGVTSGVSHHLQLIKIGQELIERGHNFTLLISSAEVSKHVFEQARGRGCQIIEFRDEVPAVGSFDSIRTILRNPETVYKHATRLHVGFWLSFSHTTFCS